MFKAALAALFLVVTTATAQAATYLYSYEFDSGDVISGTLEGFLKPDMNTVHVTAASVPLLNGGSFSEDPTRLSFKNGFVEGQAKVTLDGSVVNFALSNADFTVGFNLVSPARGVGLADPSVGGEIIEIYDPANWSLTIAVVPLPAGGLLIMSGFLGLALIRRRTGQA